jgi:hypothetical protein
MPRLPDSLEACPIDLLQRLAAYPIHAVDGNSSVLYSQCLDLTHVDKKIKRNIPPSSTTMLWYPLAGLE